VLLAQLLRDPVDDFLVEEVNAWELILFFWLGAFVVAVEVWRMPNVWLLVLWTSLAVEGHGEHARWAVSRRRHQARVSVVEDTLWARCSHHLRLGPRRHFLGMHWRRPILIAMRENSGMLLLGVIVKRLPILRIRVHVEAEARSSSTKLLIRCTTIRHLRSAIWLSRIIPRHIHFSHVSLPHRQSTLGWHVVLWLLLWVSWVQACRLVQRCWHGLWACSRVAWLRIATARLACVALRIGLNMVRNRVSAGVSSW